MASIKGFDDVAKHFEKLTKYVGRGNARVEVGLLHNAPDYPDGTSVIAVGTYNEFGGDGGKPPARHWLRKAIEANQPFYKERMAEILKKPAGIERTRLLRELARASSEKVKDHIWNNDIGLLPNKDSTARAKGGDTPMVDSQHLVRSIDSRIVE